MSNRERWIVYPLLLFAVISIAIDQVSGRALLELHTIRCQELVITSPRGAPRIVLGNAVESAGGLITIHGPSTSAGGESSHWNEVQTEIGASEDGGFVRIIGAEGVPSLYLGHQRQWQSSGLTVTDKRGEPLPVDTNHKELLDLWGPMLAWQHVPDANRDFEQAQANFGPPVDDGQSGETVDSATDDSDSESGLGSESASDSEPVSESETEATSREPDPPNEAVLSEPPK